MSAAFLVFTSICSLLIGIVGSALWHRQKIEKYRSRLKKESLKVDALTRHIESQAERIEPVLKKVSKQHNRHHSGLA